MINTHAHRYGKKEFFFLEKAISLHWGALANTLHADQGAAEKK